MKRNSKTTRKTSDPTRKKTGNTANNQSKKFGSRAETYRLTIPAHFALLCNVMDLEIEKMLYEFMSTFGMESYGKGRKAQKALIRYLIQCSYGQDHYTRSDIRRMLRELRAIALLWPKGAKAEVITQHAKWRDMYLEYWHEKWFSKPRRKKPVDIET